MSLSLTLSTRRLGLAFALSLTAPLLGCGGNDISGTGDPDGTGTIPTYGEPGCVGIGCRVRTNCPESMGPTTLTGTVTIPAGTLPLYNAKVYIPSGEVPAAPPTGASCDRCDQVVPMDAVASAVTDINGNFTLTGVPSGENVPVIIRVGKWRRVFTVNNVAECGSTKLDAEQTRLPRNQSEGNIPKIALTTGDADALECILRSKKLGLDDSEFTNPTGTGRVNLFDGENGTDRYQAGGNFPSGPDWWNNATTNSMLNYDIVLFSCEGSQNTGSKTAAAYSNLRGFLDKGGRAFASHWQNIWITGSPAPVNTVAQLVGSGGYNPGDVTETSQINTSFEKGAALSQWLQLPVVKGNSTDKPGELSVRFPKQTVTTRSATLTQDWINADPPGNFSRQSQYFSFNTPIPTTAVPKPVQCGQMVFTDIHVSGADSAGPMNDYSSGNLPFPTGCNSPSLTSQEKALIFMLFDLTNCLMPPPIG